MSIEIQRGSFEFFVRRMGTHQRLPNGNMLIALPKQGIVVEVDPNGQLVFEFNKACPKKYNGHVQNSHVVPEDYFNKTGNFTMENLRIIGNMLPGCRALYLVVSELLSKALSTRWGSSACELAICLKGCLRPLLVSESKRLPEESGMRRFNARPQSWPGDRWRRRRRIEAVS